MSSFRVLLLFPFRKNNSFWKIENSTNSYHQNETLDLHPGQSFFPSFAKYSTLLTIFKLFAFVHFFSRIFFSIRLDRVSLSLISCLSIIVEKGRLNQLRYFRFPPVEISREYIPVFTSLKMISIT